MVINQIHAIGDILFIEPICKKLYLKQGQKPLLPIRDHLMWIKDYILTAEIIPLSKFSMDIDSMDMSNPNYLPLRFANQIIRNLQPFDHSDYKNTMPDKYKLAGYDLDLWLSLHIEFNLKKGYALIKELGLVGKKFILVNNNSQAGRTRIKPTNPNNYEIVEMKEMPGYTVLDWFHVMLCAEENHHVSTCTFYIMQAIANQFDFKSKVFIYPRPNEDGLQGIERLKTTFNYKTIE